MTNKKINTNKKYSHLHFFLSWINTMLFDGQEQLDESITHFEDTEISF